ncbi:GNAT family N-acetyltransferase [Enterococcus sp. LJL90]
MEENKLVVLAEKQYLKTERLLLEPLKLAYLLDYHEYISDEETLTYEFFPTTSLAESKESLVLWNLAQPLGRYAIILKENYKMIGHITLRLSEDQKSAELGYTLNKNFWNQGFATEAVAEIIRLAFAEMGLTELIGHYLIENGASSRVLAKNGFVETSREERESLRGISKLHGTAVLVNWNEEK